MTAKYCSILAKIAICAMLMGATVSAKAESDCIGICKGQVVALGVAVAAIGAAIGIGIYIAVHHNHSLTGCATARAGGLDIQNQGDQQTWGLVGAVTDIKPGDKVRVSGKRQKKRGAPPLFIVEKLAKDYGPCKAQAATP